MNLQMSERSAEKWEALQMILRSPWFHLISVTVAVTLVYWGLWNCYFYYDDFWMLGWVRFKPSFLAGMTAELKSGYAVRPILDAHQWLRIRLFGLDAAPYYVIALLQHVIVTALVYWQARLLNFDYPTAWLSALLFGTTFVASSVVNWISGSHYSLAYIPGILSICFFILFRIKRDLLFLLVSVATFVIALFTGEWAISLLPQYVLYDLLVALRPLSLRRLTNNIITHLLYWVWLIPYAILQIRFINEGTSEYSTKLIPGFHVLKNYYYLVHLVVPNFSAAPLRRYLDQFLVPGWFGLVTTITLLIFTILSVIGIYYLWRGRAAQKFLVAWILTSFLPYALWTSDELVAADRYLYLPAVAFFTLLSFEITRWWQHPPSVSKNLRLIAPVLVITIFTLNIIFHQTWIQKQIYNGNIKRAVVEKLLRELPSPKAETHIVFEIPETNFSDLRHACWLIYSKPIKCTAFLSSEDPPTPSVPTWYWLQVKPHSLEIVDIVTQIHKNGD